ncbi:MAG: hypothetical protein IJ186_02120 [Bacilli bacterium]|nr:hypothetical protein [Bacilli bacterium]
MKKSQFPEKAFETLFIHELLTRYSSPYKTAFYIPSQVLEGNVSYDFCFVDNLGSKTKRKVIFIQFKVSEEYEKKYKGFYKFKIYKNRKSHPFKQHNRLCKYNKYGLGNIVAVYCAPRFTTMKDFYNNVASHDVINNSTLCVPRNPLYKDSHYIRFNNCIAYQCSKKPTRIEIASFSEILEKLEPISCDEFGSIINNYHMSTVDEGSHENYDEDNQEMKSNKDENKSNSSSENSYFFFI